MVPWRREGGVIYYDAPRVARPFVFARPMRDGGSGDDLAAEGPAGHALLDHGADRVHRDAHDGDGEQAGEGGGRVVAGAGRQHQEADAVVAAHRLGDHRADEGERDRDLEAGEEVGHGARDADLGQDLQPRGAEAAQHVAHLGLDGGEPRGHVDHDREEADHEGGDDCRQRADADPDHQDRHDRHLGDRIEGDQQRIEARIDEGRGPDRQPEQQAERNGQQEADRRGPQRVPAIGHQDVEALEEDGKDLRRCRQDDLRHLEDDATDLPDDQQARQEQPRHGMLQGLALEVAHGACS